jgi:hypothetical protein
VQTFCGDLNKVCHPRYTPNIAALGMVVTTAMAIVPTSTVDAELFYSFIFF